MEHKRIILCGPSASGKNFIRDKFKQKGYQIDVSYTSRYPRENEMNGIDYHFLDKKDFMTWINHKWFYEYVIYGDKYYGTGLKEWNECEVFIMETDGVSKIKSNDRPNCLIIYINTPLNIRMRRMRDRGWKYEKIKERNEIDEKKFKDFKDYDIEISSYSNEEI